MYFFTSPTSTINLPAVPHPSPAYTSTAMSRTDSRDSTTSHTSYSSAYSTSPWDSHSTSTRPTSASSMSPFNHSQQQPRRDSASSLTQCSWLPSPFRSCTSAPVSSEPTSYISDDDLLNLPPPAVNIPAVTTTIPTSRQELTTEEQIALLRAQRDKEDYLAAKERERRERTKVVRFNAHPEPAVERRRGSSQSTAAQRPGMLKRRSTAVRRNLAQLGN